MELGGNINGTVTLSVPAPPTGTTVDLITITGGILAVEPPSVKIAGGGTSGSFTFAGLALGTATITAGSVAFAIAAVNVVVE